jgi:AcrR family transcriptional regulator
MGRTKLYKREELIDKALQVFWKKGFTDTSFKDLELATGVFKPTLFSEFGDKEALFIECIHYYREHYSSKLHLYEPDVGWVNIENFLRSTYENKVNRGCFEASAFARDVPILPQKLKPILQGCADEITAAISENLKAAGVKKQQLASLTSIVFTFYCGMSTLAFAQSKPEMQERLRSFLNQIKHLS